MLLLHIVFFLAPLKVSGSWKDIQKLPILIYGLCFFMMYIENILFLEFDI